MAAPLFPPGAPARSASPLSPPPLVPAPESSPFNPTPRVSVPRSPEPAFLYSPSHRPQRSTSATSTSVPQRPGPSTSPTPRLAPSPSQHLPPQATTRSPLSAAQAFPPARHAPSISHSN